MKATYKVIDLLGEGSFGKAYLAKCDRDNKDYVIKQIPFDDMTDEEKRETFNEAIILKKLDHPNIIKFKEVFIQRKPRPALNIVTEFADGGDLSQKIEKQKKVPFTESQILDYITQICLALRHIHKKKILHRDLKSGNIFLMKSGIVKLGDFGIAKGLQSTWEKAKTLVGTPYYLSPEIITNKPYDAKSDIWALGVLLYELMTFKMPFNAVSLPLLSIKINRGVYKQPSGNYSTDIKNLLKKCLTVDPEKRPSIDEILKLPLIKNRINNFLKEVQYDQDLLITMEKKYKEERKNKKHKYKIVNNKNDKNEKIKENNNDNNNEDKNKEQFNKEQTMPMNNNNNKNEEIKENDKSSSSSSLKQKEPKRMESDKSKVSAFFKKKQLKETQKMNSPPSSGSKKDNNNINNNTPEKNEINNNNNNKDTKNLNETNFLIKRKDPEFKEGKKYKEEEIGTTLMNKGYDDLIDEKKNFDVEKMNEDQYNQLRLLNNLHKVANNLEQDSDNETETNSSMVSSASKENNEEAFIDLNIKENKNKELKNKDNNIDKEVFKEEKNELDKIKIEIEKELSKKLVNDIMVILDKYCDKTLVQFNRNLIEEKVMELKGYDNNILEKSKTKLDEIFAILIKEKIFN